MSGYQKGDKIGRYVILKEIPGGEGGMGAVYEAEPLMGSGRVALKVAHDDGADFLKNEAEVLTKLTHPHIVKILPLPFPEYEREHFVARDPEQDVWYIALEHLNGGSLRDRLQRKGRLELAEAVEIAKQIGFALDYAHAQGIVHRDLKPSNVLFRRSWLDLPFVKPQAVLTDFGIAGYDDIFWAWGAGTLAYMSPEQVRQAQGERIKVDHCCDIYALGVLLFEMLAGQVPFQGEDQEATWRAIKEELPPSPRQLNPCISEKAEAVILKALEKLPSKRFQTAGEMIKTLKKAAADAKVI
jgi:serine/threonine-protein kinase